MKIKNMLVVAGAVTLGTLAFKTVQANFTNSLRVDSTNNRDRVEVSTKKQKTNNACIPIPGWPCP
jgi:hypothetical protein